MKKIMLSTLLAMTVLCVDRVSKYWALQALIDDSWDIFYGFRLVLSWNHGISWGLFPAQSKLGWMFLTGAILLTIALFVVYTARKLRAHQDVFAEVLVLSGAISNVIDRFYFGAVIDFIQLYWAHYSFPVFNIADCCIVTGVAYIMFMSWWHND